MTGSQWFEVIKFISLSVVSILLYTIAKAYAAGRFSGNLVDRLDKMERDAIRHKEENDRWFENLEKSINEVNRLVQALPENIRREADVRFIARGEFQARLEESQRDRARLHNEIDWLRRHHHPAHGE